MAKASEQIFRQGPFATVRGSSSPFCCSLTRPSKRRHEPRRFRGPILPCLLRASGCQGVRPIYPRAPIASFVLCARSRPSYMPSSPVSVAVECVHLADAALSSSRTDYSMLFSTLSILGLALGAVAVGGSQSACQNFKLNNVANVRINATTYYAPNSQVFLSTNGGFLFASNLPGFCRLQLIITTNSTGGSSAQSEVWLPDTWNGRSLAVGNGGWSGGGAVVPIRCIDGARKLV